MAEGRVLTPSVPSLQGANQGSQTHARTYRLTKPQQQTKSPPQRPGIRWAEGQEQEPLHSPPPPHTGDGEVRTTVASEDQNKKEQKGGRGERMRGSKTEQRAPRRAGGGREDEKEKNGQAG